jgi:hypothetical protein
MKSAWQRQKITWAAALLPLYQWTRLVAQSYKQSIYRLCCCLAFGMHDRVTGAQVDLAGVYADVNE